MQPLDVRFGDIALNGDYRTFVQGEAGSEAWKNHEPQISWSNSSPGLAMVLFLDLDAGRPVAAAPRPATTPRPAAILAPALRPSLLRGRASQALMSLEASELEAVAWTLALAGGAYLSGYTSEGYEPHKL